jgi:hypothetical protein
MPGGLLVMPPSLVSATGGVSVTPNVEGDSAIARKAVAIVSTCRDQQQT